MQGVVDYMLKYPGVMPKYFGCRGPLSPELRADFERRVEALTGLVGEPVREAELAWFPAATTAACWRRDDRTLALILRQYIGGGAEILLWCVTDGEQSALAEAARTRASRVAAADFDRSFRRKLARLGKPGRDRHLRFQMFVDDLATIPERARALLTTTLRDLVGEIRCEAVDVLLALDGEQAVPAVLPLFDDPLDWVRQHVIDQMAGYGGDTAVEPLIAKLRSDPEPGVRGQAAYALGHIGGPRVIPALLDALDHDREFDALGHSPSSIAATALDNILGTNITRIKLADGLCTLAPWPPDDDALRAQARELYESWKATRNAP